MKQYIGNSYKAAAAVGIALAIAPATPLAAADAAPAATAADAGTAATTVPLEASTMIIEYNASDRDIGVQFFVDSEGWRVVRIFDPKGVQIFSAESQGRLTRQGGGTELFLESVEPELAELPLKRSSTDFRQAFTRLGRATSTATCRWEASSSRTTCRPVPC